MTTFKIDAENNITALTSSEQIAEGAGETETFRSRKELAALAEKWPATRLVEIWNGLPGVQPVERFTSRQVAVARVWKAIQSLEPGDGAQAPRAVVKKPAARKKAPHVARKQGAQAGAGERVIL